MVRPVLGWVLLVAASLGSGCRGAAPERPNLLLVTLDTLRPDPLACYGGPPDVGVGICSLAAGGTRFQWALAAAPMTAPSIASLLTSRYPARHRVSQVATSALPDAELSVAERLSAAGYATAAFVSNPLLDRTRNLAQGFDVYDDRMTRLERNRPGYEEREAEATTDAAAGWLESGARAPWFLWVHYQDPHGPYEPPGAAPERDAPGDARLPVLTAPVGYRGIPAYQALPGLFTPAAYERRYRAEIRYADAHVLRLVERADAAGAPPAILLTSDHGEALGEDGVYFSHGHSLGLDQIRVPLLFRPPRPGRARVEPAPVSLLDVAPTLLRLAGLPLPEAFEGRPLPLAGLEPGGAAPARAIFAEHVVQAAVVEGSAYYSRLRRPGEPRTTAQILGLPREATLPGDGSLPGYAPAGPGAARLERLLGGFLAAGGPDRAEAPALLSEELRLRMRALGYAE